MRAVSTALLAVCVVACGPLPGLRRPEPPSGPPAETECAVDVVNGRDVALAVTIHARSANDLGVVAPSRSVRYAEECTPRSWTVHGIPRSVPDPEGKELPRPAAPGAAPAVPPVVSQTVEVRPGVVVRVVL